MGKVTIIEPNITEEENDKNWEKVKAVMQLIADEILERQAMENLEI